MNMLKHVAAFAVVAALLSAACSKQKSSGAKLKDDLDSAAYVVGLNVGMNLLEMDSTLRIDAVCDGIRDVFARVEKMSPAEAKAFYLRWINYEQPEKIRRYEERFLEDIRQSNRSFARTPSGVTYTVEEIGDEQNAPANDRDTVEIRYEIFTADGVSVYSAFERGDTLRSALGDLLKGVQESVKLVGPGGRINAWMPAATAYGAAGDERLGIKPNATLNYRIELIKVEKYANRYRPRN